MRSVILGLALLFGALFAQAQHSPETMASAFKTSIEHEANAEWSKAIDAMKAVYASEGYEVNLRLGWLYYQQGTFSESMVYYQRACELMPLAIEARMGYVLPASALGNWKVVEAKYNEVLAIDANHAVVNYRMGMLHYGREDYQGASKYFENVVNHYPFDKDGLLMMGWTSYRLGKTREAQVLFQKVLWIDAENASAKEGLALIR